MTNEPKNPHAVTPQEVSQSASILGTKGGLSGKGAAKRRSPAHYAAISALGVKARGNAHDRRKAKRAQGSGTMTKQASTLSLSPKSRSVQKGQCK